jgi:tRNA pseudouridine38-40 synthase
VRYALGLEYDGRGFAGWQIQDTLPTLQGELERALGEIAGHPVSVMAAGRTDRGVHALGQVVHFDSDAQRPETAWVRGVNSYLPAGMAVLWATPVPEAFHARFSAIGRHYRYFLLDHSVRPALATGQVGWYHATLDVAAMQEAIRPLVGVHDFSSWRSSECQAESPIRQMREVSVQRVDGLIEFRFHANGFLHHMVRNLVGSLVAIGAHRQSPNWMAELILARDRTLAAPTFAPDGLYLSQIDYSPVFGLPDIARHSLLPLTTSLGRAGR